MKVATASIRPLITIGVGLALGATALVSVPVGAAAAAPEGAYWHTRMLWTITHPGRFGRRSDSYSLVQQQILERWTTPEAKSWTGDRELGTRPKSAADKKAWQRDGSPTKWNESIDGKTVKLSTEPSKGHVSPVLNVDSFQLAGQRLTYDEVQRLPADPNGLKSWLTKAAQVGRVSQGAVEGWVTQHLPELLYALPAPKEVRTAAYQALLTMPGVRSGGNAKDAMERPGVVIVIGRTTKQRKNTISDETKLIVDTGAMVLLSQDQAISVNGKKQGNKGFNQTLVEVGWTNSRPAVPALP